MSFNITPGNKYSIQYNLFPLQAGYVPLPYIRLNIHSDLISQTELTDLVRRTLPTSLFVMVSQMRYFSEFLCSYLSINNFLFTSLLFFCFQPQEKGSTNQSTVAKIFTGL